MKALHCPRFLGVLLGLLLLPALSARAQMGGLEGEVRDLDGNPMADVTIQIERTDIHSSYEVKTDSKGWYVYGGLAAGRARYNVRATKDGNLLYEFTGVMIPPAEMRRLDFNLRELRKQDEARLSEEQKRLLEERRKMMEKDRNLRSEFDLGVKLLREPNAANLCAARCRTSPPTESAACIATCTEEVGQNAQQLAYGEAAAALERASAIDATQYAVWANLGRAYQSTNDLEKSIAAYEKALGLKPEEAPAVYTNLVPLYVQANRTEQAYKGCEQVAATNPQQASACFFNIGVIMYNKSLLKEAVEPLRRASQLDPKRADAFYWLGVCLFGTAETTIEGGQVKTVLKPGTREAFDQYLALEPKGRYAEDAKAMLAAIEQTVPTSVRVKQK